MFTSSRLFYNQVAFLAGSILFNTSCVYSDEFMKMDPKYLNAVVPII